MHGRPRKAPKPEDEAASFVAESMKRSDQDELKYTEDLIYTNFSNYSAWHNRSVLLSALFEKKAEGFLLKEKVLPEEYEFIHQAIFTDPDDQSGWFYHLWLLDQTVRTDSPLLASSWPGHGSDVLLVGDRCYNGSGFSPFSALHSDSGSFPIVLYFNQPVGGVNSSTVTVECGFNKNEDLLWKPLSASNSQTARVWVAHLKVPSSDLHSTVEVSVGHSKGIMSTRGFEYSHPSMFSFKVHVQPMQRDSSQVSVAETISLREENFKVYGTQWGESIIDSFDQLIIKNGHETTASNWRFEALAKEIECFRELLLLVDCKIGKLTLARLLKAYDAMSHPFTNQLVHSEEVLELYSDLMKLDPTHYQFYKDEHSIVLLQKVTSSKESLLQHCFQYKDSVSSAICRPICLRLNNLSLSRMGAFEKLLWVQMLDLSHNELQSIEGLEAVQLLSCLSLRNNKLRSLTALEPLRKLKSLRILDISYNQIGDHSIDTTRYVCSSPLSHSVGSELNRDETVTSDVALINNWEAFYIFKDFNLNQLDIVGNTIADEKFKSVLVKIMPKLKQLDGKLLD
ncbi:geranylgeranyl transferase type-2 subunit alpha 1-like [Gossypium australe]|uniref:Geranylgeranyl transferase type-2 subunit alpha n=1 Tax=Gossypium australe TaxID=47621 RepID=A0A5B6W4N2_9ROSI|nr:geranylgeranyl transferase type-2 subunit alpha 1-like [Gossypium australe]